MTNTLDNEIETVRRFNRFFTRRIGVLREGLLNSPYSLTEARILFELAHREHPTASDLIRELDLDAGYLSRTLTRFAQQGLIEKKRARHDGRRYLLRLTPAGADAFSHLDRRSRDEIAAMLHGLEIEERQHLLQAMQTIENTLDQKNPKLTGPFDLRPHEPGDMGWVTHRHGLLYAQEYGWDERFEALVAEIVAAFIKNYTPDRERCWIAEMDGAIVGSIFVVQDNETTAKLRLLLVEPGVRGLGLGTRLVQECIRFARRAGYRKLILWTQSMLLPARQIYRKTGFRIIAREVHHSFGHDLIAETWALDL